MKKWIDLIKGVAAGVLFLVTVIMIESCKSQNNMDYRPTTLNNSATESQP